MIVSIDIGTSYSSICMLGPEGKAQPVDISTGASMYGSSYSLPTAVFVEDSGEIIVGQAAMNSRKRKPQNFRMEFKRNLGEDVPILLGERSFRPEELYTEIFRHMKTSAEKVGSKPVEKAYLTCPASYGERRKEKLRAAAKAAGLFDVELVDEPVAAAMCYCAEGYIQDGQTLLVYDFGGGTFDVALIQYQNGAFKLLAEPDGLEQCGGIDMDRLIFQDMLASIEPDVLEGLKGNNLHYMRFTSQLAELAVKAKHHLTSAKVFEEDIQIGFDMVPYQLTVEKFNEMIAPLVGQTIQTCRRAMEAADLDASKLSAVLMAGGTSRVPLVQEMVRSVSRTASVLRVANLELAVAQGALDYRTAAAAAVPERMPESLGNYAQQDISYSAEECYKRGQEADKREESEEAVKWYQKAADSGHADAMYELGDSYYLGIGVEKDEQQAVKWYRKAADSGHADAMYELGTFYQLGLYGVSKDKKRAVKWYRKAAELGNEDAAEELEEIAEEYYENGKEAAAYGKIKKALKWYRKAAKLGHADAEYEMDLLEEDDDEDEEDDFCNWEDIVGEYTDEEPDEEKISLGAYAEQFISSYPYIQKGVGEFSETYVSALRSQENIPYQEKILLAHLSKNSDEGRIWGTIFTDRGIHYIEICKKDKSVFTSWDKYVNAKIKITDIRDRAADIITLNFVGSLGISVYIDGQRAAWIHLDREPKKVQNAIRYDFFFALQQFLQSKCD